MKKHRNYTARKYRIVRHIIFYVVVAIVIFVLTMILGNHLKGKVDSIDHNTTDILDVTEPPKHSDADGEETEKDVLHDPALAKVSAGYLYLTAETDMQGARRAVEALRTEGHNAVSFCATDPSGNITYSSPAIQEATRLPASESLIPFDVLSEAFKAASDMGMRVSCIIKASESLSDPVVAKELCDAGADEIVVTGFEEYIVVNNDTVAKIREYTNKLRESIGNEVSIAVAFAEEFFSDPHNAPYIEKIYKYCEFLAIDMTSADKEGAESVSIDLAGSFGAYLLRPLLSGQDADVKADIDTVLSEHDIEARQYISIKITANDDEND